MINRLWWLLFSSVCQVFVGWFVAPQDDVVGASNPWFRRWTEFKLAFNLCLDYNTLLRLLRLLKLH